ncbi:hypothetical protein LA59_09265 [Vibrio harveyi]|nr:hypothetical protein LA59_09265 [Vibrio harveyi]
MGLNKESATKHASQAPYYLQRVPFGSVSLKKRDLIKEKGKKRKMIEREQALTCSLGFMN